MQERQQLAQGPAEIDEQEQRFSNARQLLSDVMELPDLQRVLGEEECLEVGRVYTQAPTLTLLMLQRLEGCLSLTAAVQQLLTHHRDLLTANCRVEEQTLSENNSALSKARQRLPLKKVEAFVDAICNHLAERSEPVWQGRRVMILDGTTITLPPASALKKAFPPATNQPGKSAWPVAMLMVASELATGCVLAPEIGAMYGPDNTSEAAQAERMIDRLPTNALVLAESGFGIFRVAYHCQLLGKEFVFRLTAGRFKSYQKNATQLNKGPGFGTWELQWLPSPKERSSNPHLPQDVMVKVFVHQIVLDGKEDVYLITNVEADAQALGALYLRRYDVEFDIRDLKVTMDTENIRAKRLDTALTELLGSVIAYNLVAQFRRQAAKQGQVSPRRLSFSGVWLSFTYHLLYAPAQSFEDWQKTYIAALKSASKRRLPNRSQPRS